MKWRGRTGSGNVQTRSGSGGLIASGGIGMVILLAIALITGDPSAFINGLLGNNQTTSLSEERVTELTEFVTVILGDTETVWNQVFESYGKDYQEPTLVLFTGSVDSACGTASSAVGPFYCSEDETIYLDLEFFDELETRFNAPGDFAMAYVIAHEVGHHVQNQLGILDEVHQQMANASETEANALSVRLELQADYLSGVWAYYVQGYGYLEAGDVDEALNAATAIGDDRIQAQTQGTIIPDSFTHGTSEQRARWFRKGLTSGNLEDGDTFSATILYNLTLIIE
jgi:predicted metalloprotease